MTLTAFDVFRNYVTSGVVSSGKNKVNKAEAREWGKSLEASLDVLASADSDSPVKFTLNDLNQVASSHGEGDIGYVVFDTILSNRGVYVLTGGSWVRKTSLPVDFAAAYAASAATSDNNSLVNANTALAAAQAVKAFAASSGIFEYADTYSDALTKVAAAPNGKPFIIWNDETKGGARTIYVKESGVLVYKTTASYDVDDNFIPTLGGFPSLIRYSNELVQIPEYHGVSRSITTTQQTRLQQMFTDCANDKKKMVFPNGVFSHDGELTSEGAWIEAGPSAEFRALTPSAGASALVFTGSGVKIKGVRTTSPNTTVRVSGAQGIKLQGATDFYIEDVVINGAASSGLAMTNGCQRGVIIRPRIISTKADGLTIIGASKKIDIYSPYLESTGDDSFSVVSYVSDGDICEDINVFGGVSLASLSRGFVVIGGRRVRFYSPYIKSSVNSALLFIRDGNPSYNTFGVSEVIAYSAIASDCVNGTVAYGVFQTGGSSGTNTATTTTEVISNSAINSGFQDCVSRGAGNGTQAGVAIKANSILCFSRKGRIYDLLPPDTSKVPVGLLNNGQDTIFEENYAENVAGAFIQNDVLASGRWVDRKNKSVGAAARLTAGVKYIRNFVAAAGVVRLVVEDVDGESGTVSDVTPIRNVMTRSQYEYRRNFHDGVRLPDAERVNLVGTAFVVDLTNASTVGSSKFDATVSTTQTVEIRLLKTMAADIKWQVIRTNNKTNWADRKERWHYIATAGGTGTAGIDFVSVDAGTGVYQRTTDLTASAGSPGTWSVVDNTTYISIIYTPTVTAPFNVICEINVARGV